MPELALDLPRTQAELLTALTGLELEIRCYESSSAITAVIRGDRPGPTVLLRADMDALPVRERGDLEFASDNENMHACGHDLHMAGLVGAVHELAGRRDELAGTVLAVFQPGEEGAGGAQLLIDEGVLLTTGELPVASYGVHVLSYCEPGTFQCREGAVMGATSNFTLTINGRGGHAARPHQALDPVTTAALVVTAIQTLVAQRSSPGDPIVATVGSLVAGTAGNVIPDDAVLRISLRATTAERARSTEAQIVDISRSIAGAYGLTVDAVTTADLPPTITDASGAVLVEKVVADLFGPEKHRAMAFPEMIAEDFSLFLQQTGGAFVLVGAAAGPPPYSVLPTNHSADVRFDDSVVPQIASFLAELAVRRLQEG
ncbi:amidohydrolase [Nakamurella sp. YIM 132087]|uniref:Amidohydrolase n=2 Tax=Nakamurella alba TaxID=2665158 RepID=A0A7K1FQ44_9ACTN|nr:amidohydrolase [Nakamurella alba]